MLDFDLAWRALATALLDLDCESVDLDVLLDWSRRADAAALVAALPEPVERHLEDWLRPRLGPQVDVVLASLDLTRLAADSDLLPKGYEQAFAAHAALKQVSSPKAPPRLFHKADLTEPGTGALAGGVRAAIAAEQPRVIGVVVNVIDDQLSSNAQLGVPWSLASVAVLRQMLEAAKESGRLVVLTSDHGHVLDHDIRLVQTATEAERYRSPTELPPGAEPASEEVLIQGRRVALPDHSVMLPWSERLRYGAQKMGYHGGGAPQEVLVPFGVFRSLEDLQPVAGWQEMPRRQPHWWALDAGASIAEPAVTAAASSTKDTKGTGAPAAGQLALDFAGDKPAAPADETGAAVWIDALLASPVYARINLDTAVQGC